jgi:autotransporter translocation and assembly factor TamB
VNARARLAGKPNAPNGSVQAEFHNLKYRNTYLKDAELSADYRRQRLSAELSANGGLAGMLKAKASIGLRLDIKQGEAKIANDRKVDLLLDAEGIRLDAVADWFPETKMSGLVDIHVLMNGSPVRPDFKSSIHAHNLEWSGIKVGRADADVSFQNRSADIQLLVEGGVARRIEARGTFPIQVDLINGVSRLAKEHHELDIESAGLDFDSIEDILAALMPDSQIPALHLKGVANIQAHLSGEPASPDLNIYADFKDLHWESRRIGDGAIGFDLQSGKADVHAQITQGNGRYADLKATFSLGVDLEKGSVDWRPEKEHRLALLADGLDATLVAPFVDIPDGVDFRFKGSCTGAGSSKKFLLNAKWQGDLRREGFASLPIKGELSASQEKQSVKFSIGPGTNPFMLIALDTDMSRGASPEGSLDIKNTPFKARIDVPGLKLALISPLLPTALYGVEGTVKGQFIATGTIDNPSIQGRLELDDGAVTIAALNQRLRKVGFVVSLDKAHARIDKLRFESGKGQGKGSFEMSYKGNGRLTGQGNFILESFPFVRPGVPEGLINSKIAARFHRGPDDTDVEIKFEDTYVRLLTRTSSRVPKKVEEPTNVTFADRRGREALNRQPIESPAPTENRELRLSVDMTDPSEISGSGVDMRWAGKLSLISSQGKSEARGEIRALPGRFQLLANSFEIESGEITLPSDGELDPFVNIVAHTTTPEAEVTVTVRGRASRPELILTSDPAMSQYQIISLLVTGRSDTADRTDENVQTEAASLLLAFQNPVLERQLYSRLGVDRVDVALGQSVEEPILIVGKRLGKRWYVETEYHHNAPEDENMAGVRIEYQLSPSWSLESVYGDANKGEVGVYWRKRFDRPIQNGETHNPSEKDKDKDKDKGKEQ